MRRDEVYPFGFFGIGLGNTLFTQWIVYFHAPPGSASGHASRVIGAALLAGFVLQALLNPWVGQVADRLRPRPGAWIQGRRRPFVLFGLAPFVLVYLGLWSSSHLAAGVALVLLYHLGYALVTQPYVALLPTLAPPGPRRVRFTLTGALSLLAGAGCALVGGPWLLEATSFRGLGLAGAGAFLLCLGLPTWVLREPALDPSAPHPSAPHPSAPHPSDDPLAAATSAGSLAVAGAEPGADLDANADAIPDAESLPPASLLASFREVAFAPGHLPVFLASALVVMVATALTMAVPYVVEAVLQRPRTFTATLNGSLLAGIAGGVLVVGALSKRVAARWLLAAGSALGALVLGALTLLSLQPQGGPPLAWCVGFGLLGYLALASMVVPALLVSDLVDRDREARGGPGREGLFFGVNGSAFNLGNALCSGGVASLLGAGSAGLQPDGVRWVLGLNAALLLVATALLLRVRS